MPDPVKKKTKKKLSKKMIAASRKSAAQLRVLARAKRAKRSVAKPKKKFLDQANAQVGSAGGAARLKRKAGQQAGKQMTRSQYEKAQLKKAKKKGVKKPMKPKKKSIRRKMY